MWIRIRCSEKAVDCMACIWKKTRLRRCAKVGPTRLVFAPWSAQYNLSVTSLRFLPTALAGKIMRSVVSIRPFVSTLSSELIFDQTDLYVCMSMGHERRWLHRELKTRSYIKAKSHWKNVYHEYILRRRMSYGRSWFRFWHHQLRANAARHAARRGRRRRGATTAQPRACKCRNAVGLPSIFDRGQFYTSAPYS